ncbi:MAG: hypothetical protein CSB55_02500 [Candidatus Cloacimonadota bacterium]|nr:MAG: hypothetical protein CSB55_02500 [Candidatus Cloacimonadota bacterium]
MKKFIGLALAGLFMASGLSAEFMNPKTGLKAMDAKKIQAETRDIVYANIDDPNGVEFPEWEFVYDEDVDIETNFYDYMPGSYNAIPMSVNENGRVFIVFHRTPTNNPGELRRVYFAQIEDGVLVSNDNVTSEPGHQGYAGLALDPVSSDPFYVWHENMDDDASYEVHMAWEAYSFAPTVIKSGFPVIDNSEIAGVDTPFADDEFIWPYIFIRNSPAGNGMRRIFVIANNYKTHAENPSESALIAYADFDDADVSNIQINAFAEKDWNYETVPMFDAWNAGEGGWVRPMKAPFVTEDGAVVFMGHLVGDNYHNGDANLFYIHTDDIANPDWQASYSVGFKSLPYPANSAGGGTMGVLHESLGYTMANTGHFNIVESSDGKLRFIGDMALGGQDESDPSSEVYFPDFQYVKEFVLDPVSGEYEVVDLFPQGVDIHDDQPVLPWDLNEDGEYDNTVTGEDGTVWPVVPDNFPIEYWDTEQAFHMNKFSMVAAENQPWLFAMWMDATKSRKVNGDNPDEEYNDYAEVPEIFVCVSADNGQSWTKPLVMNSMNTPKFEGQIPAAIYPGNKIIVDGDYGYIDLFYLDDNTYGSGSQGAGAADGGTQKYNRIKINFSNISSNDGEEVIASKISTQNYPNPFNPTTAISFNINKASNVNVKIYNVKGALVKTIDAGFQNAGPNSVIWNGVDNDNNSVASGVYFYKVTAGNETAMNKMILMK